MLKKYNIAKLQMVQFEKMQCIKATIKGEAEREVRTCFPSHQQTFTPSADKTLFKEVKDNKH